MAESQKRRRFYRVFSDFSARLRLFVPYLGFMAAWWLIILAIGALFHHSLTHVLNPDGTVSAQDLAKLHKLGQHMMDILIVGIGVTTALCFAFWLQFSHGVFGPMVQIRRHINRMREGDYQSQIRLRAGDEFKNVADALNELAKSLQKGPMR